MVLRKKWVKTKNKEVNNRENKERKDILFMKLTMAGILKEILSLW